VGDLTVLVVDDDFRVASMHAGIVSAMPGFTVEATVTTLTAARKVIPVDLALVDVYLPDGSGVDFVRELRGDAIMLTAAVESQTVREAIAAGALGILVKPFAPTELAARLAGYARYRKILSPTTVTPDAVDAALDALRPKIASLQPASASTSPTKALVLQSLQAAGQPMSAAEVAAATGVSRATAQRYLAAMASSRDVTIGLRYGTTGRPEQEFSATTPGPARR
jgi:response regulator of citrate/malate metabolism